MTAAGQTAFTRLTDDRNLLNQNSQLYGKKLTLFVFIDRVNKFKTHILQDICVILKSCLLRLRFTKRDRNRLRV